MEWLGPPAGSCPWAGAKVGPLRCRPLRNHTPCPRSGGRAPSRTSCGPRLASILGYAELLGDLAEQGLSEQVRRFVGIIHRNAQREMRLVDDLLTIVSIEGGQMAVRPRSIDLLRVVTESCERLQPVADEAGIHLAIECDLPAVLMAGDPVRLGQAIDNLTANALKFSPAGGRVTLNIAREGDTTQVDIADQGPGIPSDERPRVFDRLFRGVHAVEEEKAGAGLGLAIVKAIIEAHADSVAILGIDSGGTCVRVRLPSDSVVS